MRIALRLAFLALLAATAAAGVAASAVHDIVYKGTVVAVDAKTVKVSVINEKTKKPETMTFEHDHETKILRGDTLVSFAEAKIQKNEKIAVTINHDDFPDFALVVRLEPRK